MFFDKLVLAAWKKLTQRRDLLHETELSDLAKTLEKAAESEDVALINEKHGILIGKYKKLAEDIESSVI